MRDWDIVTLVPNFRSRACVRSLKFAGACVRILCLLDVVNNYKFFASLGLKRRGYRLFSIKLNNVEATDEANRMDPQKNPQFEELLSNLPWVKIYISYRLLAKQAFPLFYGNAKISISP